VIMYIHQLDLRQRCLYVFRDSYGGECDVKPVMPERDSFVRISVTDVDDHSTPQITESRTHAPRLFILSDISVFLCHNPTHL